MLTPLLLHFDATLLHLSSFDPHINTTLTHRLTYQHCDPWTCLGSMDYTEGEVDSLFPKIIRATLEHRIPPTTEREGERDRQMSNPSLTEALAPRIYAHLFINPLFSRGLNSPLPHTQEDLPEVLAPFYERTYLRSRPFST
jgi:hypothetical protein